MKIGRIVHKGLANLHERGNAAKIDGRLAAKLRLQLDFLQTMNASEELRMLPFWKPHQLNDGRWSLHVTANWRLTFQIDDHRGEITDLNLEDYQ